MSFSTGRLLSRLCAAACALVLSLAALGAAQTVHAAHASSSGANRIDLHPDFAPVGTLVDVSLTLYTAPSGQQLRLTAAPWDTPGACLKSVPIPGVAPFDPSQPLPAVTNVKITWPAELAHGQYVICALATGDNTVVASSFAPFTVDDGTITPTPTLLPEQYPTPISSLPPSASVLDGTSDITPGSDVHIEIDHWSPPDSGTGAPMMQVALVSADTAAPGQVAPAAAAITAFSLVAQPPDSSLLTLTLPPGTAPGSYRVVITEKGAPVAETQPFPVATGATTRLLGAQAHAGPPGLTPAGGGPTPLTLLVAALLALAVVILAGPALARRMRRRAE